MDVVQETYLRAHQAFPGFVPDDESAFNRWIYMIAENCLRDLARHHDAQRRSPPGLAQSSSALSRLRAEQMGPSTAYGLRERNEQLQAALERLGEDERQAILLRHYGELTLPAVAAVLGCSLATAKRLLGNARVKLGIELRASE